MRRVKVLGLLALPIAVLAVVAMVMSWSFGSADKAEADLGHTAGVEFHIDVVAGGASCTTAADAKGTCVLPLGGTFTVRGFLDDISGIGGTPPSYDALAVTVSGVGVTNKPLVPNSPAGPSNPDMNVWPDCVFEATSKPGNALNAGCSIGTGAPSSTYTGQIFSGNFNCTASGSLTMVHSGADTLIIDSPGVTHTEAGPDVLNIDCRPATATPTPTPTPTPPPVPRMLKHDEGPIFSKPSLKGGVGDVQGDTLGNIWLTRQGDKLPPQTCLQSSNSRRFAEGLSQPIVTTDPKNPSQVQILGAFEFEVRFDPKLVCVALAPGPAAASMLCVIQDSTNSQLEGIARMGCVTVGKFKVPPPIGPKIGGHLLAFLTVLPQPELWSQLRPNQDNGITAQLLDQGCELGDEQGHPIPIFSCEDADVTIRYLEGDVSGPDCGVDVFDAQDVAFRWGARKGSQLYSSFRDLEPSGQVKGDGDIDIKDLQFVFGRFGSSCTNPHPSQPPVNPKA